MSEPERALATIPAQTSAIVLTAENQALIEAAVQARAVLDQMLERVLIKGVDVIIIPGTDKLALSLSGAETMSSTMNLRPAFIIDKAILPDPAVKVEGVPLLSYSLRCQLWSRKTDALIGEGVGACNSWETKYRYRYEPEIDERGRKKKDAKGRVVMRKIENPNVWDLQNTIYKMAKKRAFVDAALNVTGGHRIFTADLEEELLSMEPATDSQLDWLEKLLAGKKDAEVDALMTRVIGEPVELDMLTKPQASLLIDELQPAKEGDDGGRKRRRRRRGRRAAATQGNTEPEPAAQPAPAPQRTIPPAAMPPDPARVVHVGDNGATMTAKEIVERLVRIPLRRGPLDGKTLLDVVAEQGLQQLVIIHDTSQDKPLRKWCEALSDALMPQEDWGEHQRLAGGGD